MVFPMSLKFCDESGLAILKWLLLMIFLESFEKYQIK